MAINTALLIAAPILQDYFSDNATDAAMSDGVITCYHDNSRTVLKNWYYQTGTPGAYTYTPLPNPLTLSAAGTITDAMGNDTIPFWYPYLESDNVTPDPYYVTVDNSNGQRQFTRQNFPFVAPSGASPANSTLRNLIVNNVFWRNAGTLTLTNTTQTVIAPSQHDGFISNMSDMIFVKDATGATDTLTFTQFPSGSNRLPNDATPEYYINFQCASSGSSETVKYIQIPICLHVDNLSEYPSASVTLWTQNISGSSNNTITLKLLQFLGTGVVSPAAQTIATITPGTGWVKTVVPFPFPEATVPTGGPGDDAWFLQIGFPVALPFNMNIAKPSIYLSVAIPDDDFDTYEYVSGTIDAPRTGDIRQTINNFSPFGWVPMNDQTIGNASSGSTSRANTDTWPLFSLIWNCLSFVPNLITIIPIYDSAGVLTSYGASAIDDFNANKRLSLTKALGRVMMGGLNDGNGQFQGQQYTRSGNTLVMSTALQFFVGAPVFVLNTGGAPPSPLVEGTIYYAVEISGTQISLATTYANALAGVVIPLTTAGSGTNTVFTYAPGTFTGEFQHTLLESDGLSRSELPDPITSTAATVTVTPGAGASVIVNSAVHASGTVSNNGGNTSFNITQPGAFYSFFMKL